MKQNEKFFEDTRMIELLPKRRRETWITKYLQKSSLFLTFNIFVPKMMQHVQDFGPSTKRSALEILGNRVGSSKNVTNPTSFFRQNIRIKQFLILGGRPWYVACIKKEYCTTHIRPQWELCGDAFLNLKPFCHRCSVFPPTNTFLLGLDATLSCWQHRSGHLKSKFSRWNSEDHIDGLITDRGDRYCWQNWYFRNKDI